MRELYLVVFGLFVVCSLLDFGRYKATTKQLLYVGLGAVLFLFAGLRDGDYVPDYKIYEWVYNDDMFVFEPTFTVISVIVRWFFGGGIIWLFLIYAALGVWIKLVAIRKLTPFVFLSLLVYVSDFYVLQELVQMRASMATGIFLLSIPSLYERRAKSYFGLTFLATMFHISSLMMIPLWFLKGERINKPFWVGAILFGYAFALAKIDLISILTLLPIGAVQEKYEAYKAFQDDGDYQANVFSLLFLLKLLLTFILLWKSELIVRVNRYGYLLIKLMFVSLLSLLLFSQNLAAGLRISEFMGVVIIVLLPMYYYVVKPRWAAWFIMVVVCVGFMLVRIFSMNLISTTPL